jgi:hypothetical protein
MISMLVVAVPVAAVFVSLGSAKVFALAPMRARAAHLGFSTGSYRAIGMLEIAAAVGVLLGMVAPLIGGLAGIGLLLLLGGAVIAHLRNGDRPLLLTPAVVAALLVVAYLVILLGVGP